MENLKFYNKIYFILFLIGLLTSLFLPSYYSMKLTELVSNPVVDYWCPDSQTGIGLHCFGDFFYNFTVANEISPWSANQGIPYPPLSIIYSKPFILIGQLLGFQISLILNISLALLCLLIPFFYLNKVYKIKINSLIPLIFIILFSTPTLTILDRGNNLIILFPILFFFVLNLINSKYNYALYLLLFMSLFRPQFILLCFIFLFRQKYVFFFKSIVFYFVLTLTSFLFYPQNYLLNLKLWGESLLNYNSLSTSFDFWPTNYSFKGTINVLIFLLTKKSNPEEIFNSAIYSYLGLIIFSFSLVFLFILKRFVTLFELVLLFILFIILIPGVTFSYYLIFILPLLFFLYFYFEFENQKVNLKINLGNFSTLAIYLSSYSLVPLIFPTSTFSFLYSENTNNLISLLRLSGLFILISFILLITQIIYRYKRKEVVYDK